MTRKTRVILLPHQRPAPEPGPDESRVFCRRFTLLEVVAVLLLISLVMGLVAPRIGRMPGGIAARSLVTAIQSGCRDAGMRARASGKTVRLVLEIGANRFRIRDAGSESGADVAVAALDAPPGVDAPGRSEAGAAAADGEEKPTASIGDYLEGEYELPKGTTWSREGIELEAEVMEQEVYYEFFPGGEASGPDLQASVAGRTFTVSVDSLTGRPLITQIEEGL